MCKGPTVNQGWGREKKCGYKQPLVIQKEEEEEKNGRKNTSMLPESMDFEGHAIIKEQKFHHFPLLLVALENRWPNPSMLKSAVNLLGD